MRPFADMGIPAPRNWQLFEAVALTCLRIKWQSPNLQGNGRDGQPQCGVDIHGPDHLGRFVGVQCKLRETRLTDRTIAEEISKAEDFRPTLSAYYFATTAPSDAVLQRRLRLVSEDRIRSGKFPVGVFFWDDLLSELMRNQAEYENYLRNIGIEVGHKEVRKEHVITTNNPFKCLHCGRESIMPVPALGRYSTPVKLSKDRSTDNPVQDYGCEWEWYVVMCPYCLKANVIEYFTDLNTDEWDGESYDEDGAPDTRPIREFRVLYPLGGHTARHS
jgi:hypothetical protein